MRYTFGQWVPIQEEQPIAIQYYDEAGAFKVIPRLERTLLPMMIGGKLTITFEKEDQVRMSMDWP